MKVKEPIGNWRKFEVAGWVFIIAENPEQGLAGSSQEELGDSVMIFTKVITNLPFDNEDHGYGPVTFDIDIAFLDEEGKVLQISCMEAHTGKALPSHGSKYAMETLSGWFKDKNIGVGEIFPNWNDILSQMPA